MRKFLNIVCLTCTMILMSSCLNSNLKDLDTYSGNDITSVVAVYHRYYGDTDVPISGAKKVLQAQLTLKSVQIDKEAGTCEVSVSIPSNFPAAQKDKVTTSNLVVIVGISSAAIIKPASSSPAFGTPGDWSKTNTYVVKAANDNTKEWKVTLHLE